VPAPHIEAPQTPAVSESAGDTEKSSPITDVGSEQTKSRGQPMLHSSATEKHETFILSASSEPQDHNTRPIKRQKRDVELEHDRLGMIQPARETRRWSNALPPAINQPPSLDVTDALDLAPADGTMGPYPISLLTMEYLDLYFAYINQETYAMLPKAPFLKWVRDCPEKTLDDKMILYTLMGMGCRFSARKESVAHGKRFLQIARDAEQNSFGRFTLQLVQARLLLALLNFSLGNSSEAWDYCGTAVRAACALKYNSEEGITSQSQLLDLEYGLNGRTLAECRRRTFWSAYVMDVSVLPFGFDHLSPADFTIAVQRLVLRPSIDLTD
jgi:Fungal specific transcription factor domain